MKESKNKVWVLTYEVNDHDQHGEYFVAVFADKPTIEQLVDATGHRQYFAELGELLKFLQHLQNGGGRRNREHIWYNLNEVELG